ncbi:MAG: adenylyl-sulfate reductase subunit alpha [Dehalococcoidia bacterium]|nr:MAG: adenylyl-sulfate reductase subunit alpha [Dehalococcoidia bacterium]
MTLKAADFETVEVTTDLLIIGGGMAACGAAVEAAYWAKKNNLKVTVVDKAAMDRSGAVAMGLSALNQYVGMKVKNRSPENYVEYVRQDLMGVSREDMVYDIARHVDGTVHLFEKWGLPIWKDEGGNYVFEGPWQLMINGESYKIVIAEAAKNAMATLGDKGEIIERVFITEPLLDGDKIAGAVGFSVRENKFYVFKAKAVLCAMGGAVHVFKPRSTGEGFGRSWYPPFNSGSSCYFMMKAGAEHTCQEVRFIPVRFKDAYGPVGAWFLLFKSRATTALGGEYMVENKAELDKWAPYGLAKPIPANLRNWLMMLDTREGKGPAYMRTEEAMKKIIDAEPDEKARKKRVKEVESEAWEDFLDMTISQAILWAGTNTAPEEKPSELQACDPYFIGSHSGASGAWLSGPEDLQTAESKSDYFWGYNRMATIKGLFGAGDASGASSHKFSDGSHAEGRIAAKAAIAYIVDNKTQPNVDAAQVEAAKQTTLKPLDTFAEFSGQTTDPNVNENYIVPEQYMYRLQKIMDEYAGGVVAAFSTNEPLMDIGMNLLAMLNEDAENLAARDHHELMRAHECRHRTMQADTHIRSVYHRKETRWPGYYFRADTPKMDNDNWLKFVNIKLNKDGKFEIIERKIHKIC